MKQTISFLSTCTFVLLGQNASSQCSGTQTFLYTGSLQTFVVPAGVTSIYVDCYGAKGGNGNIATSVGGSGAYVSGDLDVVPGETINIIAGGMCVSGVMSLEGGGGGGGSFIVRASDNSPLMIAGGGGGGSYQAGTVGQGGTATTTGGPGGYVPTLPGMGGFTDNGGGGGTGGGGGGWTANGSSNIWSEGGYMAGGAGGISIGGYIGDGGFGGGAGAFHGGGGGGGYSGGGGGVYTLGGGGGASYNTSSTATNIAAFNAGNGFVNFSWDITYFTTESDSICSGTDYLFPDGTTQTNITSQVIHNSLLTAVIGGCDSTVETTVDVYPALDNGVSQSVITLTADEVGAAYQWVECDSILTTFTPIAGETNQDFTPVADGSYAVVITKNGCADTSACMDILYFGIHDANSYSFSIAPNPVNDLLSINHPEYAADALGEIVSITGAVSRRFSLTPGIQTSLDLYDLNPGIYFIRLVSTDGVYSTAQKLVKK